jgi:hypothetical protein
VIVKPTTVTNSAVLEDAVTHNRPALICWNKKRAEGNVGFVEEQFPFVRKVGMLICKKEKETLDVRILLAFALLRRGQDPAKGHHAMDGLQYAQRAPPTAQAEKRE